MKEQQTGLHEAFLAAQQQFGKLKKDSANPYFNSSYVDINSVLDEILPILNQNGFIVIQLPSHKDGVPYLKTVIQHSSGSAIESEMLLLLNKNDSQSHGSAITYARRYSLVSMLGLRAEDDDGNAATHSNAPQKKQDTTTYNLRTPASPSTAKAASDSSAGETVVHFGKNKGKKLKELMPNSLSWYAEEWEAGDKEQDQALKEAAIEMMKDSIPF